MYSFTICLLILVVGYFVYGRYVERVFGPEAKRPTPALTKADGVDYIPLPTWKIFMIQFLNIAGLGPIFGAIMGAKFGTASYLWIVLGSVLAGATHDYFSGMLSIRHGGESLPEIIGRYLGMTTKQVMRGFTVILMVLVGAVFVAGPAGLLAKLTPDALDTSFWIVVVFLYYILATLLPVDKIIGKIYPIFAIALLFYGCRDFSHAVRQSSGFTGVVGRLTKYPSECGESARFPDYVREYRLWGYFRFSCHTVADDGPLYEE